MITETTGALRLYTPIIYTKDYIHRLCETNGSGDGHIRFLWLYQFCTLEALMELFY